MICANADKEKEGVSYKELHFLRRIRPTVNLELNVLLFSLYKP